MNYVSEFKERLCKAWECARDALISSQIAMKKRFDLKSVKRAFPPGDRVLALLPVQGSALSTRFSEEKLPTEEEKNEHVTLIC